MLIMSQLCPFLYDTIDKTWATTLTTLFRRVSTIPLNTSVRDRDRLMKQSCWGGGPCFNNYAILCLPISPQQIANVIVAQFLK